MERKEFIENAIKEAEIKWAKMQAAKYYKETLETIIGSLKFDGFKVIILGDDIRVTF